MIQYVKHIAGTMGGWLSSLHNRMLLVDYSTQQPTNTADFVALQPLQHKHTQPVTMENY